ncbi:hypothetical protein BC941DRAFT_473929 [Chlamydoabsidia padenii]|nr:hypothetical protein BC941DRAFT_473929 [Chlamydoabsidia padenii]
MFLLSKLKVIPYYNYYSLSVSSSATSFPSSSLASPASFTSTVLVSVSSSDITTSITNNSTIMEFNNKVGILERNFAKSVHDTRKRVLGDDLLMDEQCDKIKTSMNLIDNIVIEFYYYYLDQ